MNDPVIPLKYAELLHVAMSTMVTIIAKKTNYPVENLEAVLGTYRVSRDKHLKADGYSRQDIHIYTAAAAEAMLAWLEEAEDKKSESKADFDRWARELMDE